MSQSKMDCEVEEAAATGSSNAGVERSPLEELREFRRKVENDEELKDKLRLELKMVRLNRANVRPPNEFERKAFFRESVVQQW